MSHHNLDLLSHVDTLLMRIKVELASYVDNPIVMNGSWRLIADALTPYKMI